MERANMNRPPTINETESEYKISFRDSFNNTKKTVKEL